MTEAFLYEEPGFFLGEGEFSRRDSVVKKAAEELMGYDADRGLTEEKAKMQKVEFFLRRNIPETRYWIGSKVGRERTASQVIQSGYFMNCIDRSLVLATLAREVGIPAKYVEAFTERMFRENVQFRIHAFADLFVGGEWRPCDPGCGFAHHDDVYFSCGEVYSKIAEGIDFSQMYPRRGRGPIKIYTREELANLFL